MYSEKVMDHFQNPRNSGIIDNADAVGETENEICGDKIKIYINIVDNKIKDIKFKTFGCGAAIAASSMMTEMAKGKSLEEVLKIENKDIAEALGGLPSEKMHCSNIPADALHEAIENYKN